MARSAAARDGLSVGDWLTRRIYAESNQEVREASAEPPSSNYRSESNDEARGNRDEVMRQLVRMEAESESAFRKIDEALHTLGRRLERSEHAQNEANTPVHRGASEIIVETREQAQKINHLARRVENIERATDSAPLRNAVRGLHQGVSRLAEQVAKTENDSFSRIEALHRDVESASKLTQATRVESSELAKDIGERLSALTEQIARSEDQLGGMEDRIQEVVGKHTSSLERNFEEISGRLSQTETRQSEQQNSVDEAFKGLKEELSATEKRHQEAYSEFRLSLEEMRRRLDSADMKQEPEPERRYGAAPSKDESHSPLPGMDAEFASPEEDTRSTSAMRESLSAARDTVNPTAVTELPTVRQDLASARANRTEDLREDQGLNLRRSLPAISVGLLLVTGVVYLILSSGLSPIRDNFGAALDSSAPATASAAPADSVALAASDDYAAGVQTAEGIAPQTTRIAVPMSSDPIESLLSGARDGSPAAALLVGLQYLEGNDAPVSEGVRWLQVAAEQGEPMAQYRLGSIYEHGRSVPADPSQATFWYEQAARGGNRKAMHNFAVAYVSGIGIEQDFAEGLRWFGSAADLGLADSQFNLGVLFESGLGTPTSLNNAYKWYLIAAAQGDSEARARARILAMQLTEDQRQAAERAAATFAPRPFDHAANELPTLAQLQ